MQTNSKSKAQEYEEMMARAMSAPGVADIEQVLELTRQSSQILDFMRPVSAVRFLTTAHSTPEVNPAH